MKQYIYILIILLLASCYDDKGNYDYTDVNTVESGLEEVYYRFTDETIVTIDPKLSQSLEQNKENLKFLWLHSTTGTNFYVGSSVQSKVDTVCETEELRFTIDLEDPDLKYEHYFRLTVYDTSTGIEYQYNTKLKLGKPYDGAWMILHSKDGQTELGAVEYVGEEMIVKEDVYYDATGKRFQGKPLCLGRVKQGCSYYNSSSINMFSVITDIPDEAGVYNQLYKFEKKDSLSRMVYENAQINFDFSKVENIDGQGTRQGLLLSNGRFYQTPAAMKIYEPKIDEKLTGDVYISHAAKIGQITLMYDQAGHRFAQWYNFGSGGNPNPEVWADNDNPSARTLASIPVRSDNNTDADPNSLDPEHKVLFIGPGYFYKSSNDIYMYANALAIDGKGGCFVYEFDAYGIGYNKKGSPAFRAYYRLNQPEGLDENSCFASTSDYSGILFYSSGNTLYRFDFQQTGGKATPVYTHPGSKRIRHMEFARTEPEKAANITIGYENYGYDLSRSLGIAFEMEDGTCDFVVLNLSANGYIGSDNGVFPAKQVHEGFGEITDFVFL
ncbi:PKD-like family lipoprotein [Butyricimonas hominis]|uniref:PKD-like family lipoprotein n=1 Tax=Butyricimonas TaxID=574697 RepID=UPI00351847D4